MCSPCADARGALRGGPDAVLGNPLFPTGSGCWLFSKLFIAVASHVAETFVGGGNRSLRNTILGAHTFGFFDPTASIFVTCNLFVPSGTCHPFIRLLSVIFLSRTNSAGGTVIPPGGVE
jgi:hypothetical protein